MKSQVRLDKLWFLHVFAQCCTHAHKFCATVQTSQCSINSLPCVVPEGTSITISRIKCVALKEGG